MSTLYNPYKTTNHISSFRSGSGESTRSETGSLANGNTIDGDPSQPSFPVSVVVDETVQSKNNGIPFDKTDSNDRLNVANGNGGVPNGNSHKGQFFFYLYLQVRLRSQASGCSKVGQSETKVKTLGPLNSKHHTRETRFDAEKYFEEIYLSTWKS